MRANVDTGSGGRRRRPIRSDIFQICVGLVLAMFLFQADRTISAPGVVGALPHAVVSRDAIAAGIHLVDLECNRLAAVLNRVVRIGATPCRFTTNFK